MNLSRLATIILPLGLLLAGCNGGSSSVPAGNVQTPGTQVPGDDTPGAGTPGTALPGNENPGTEIPVDPNDRQAPVVVATIPGDNSETVSGNLFVEFDEAIAPSSVSADSVVMKGPAGVVDVELNVNGTKVELKPRMELESGAAYTVTVDGAVTDLAGNRLGTDYSWHFTISRDICSNFYASNFSLVEGKDATPPRSGFAKPAKGVRYADPVYGTCIVRATDHDAEGLAGFARNDYARRQPFNADDSNFLIYSQDGYWHLYKTSDLSYVRKLFGGGGTEPQWHPTNPDLLYLFPNNGVGMTISTYNVRTGEKTVVADLRKVNGINGHPGDTSITDIWPNAFRAWTKSEGSPSADARYWALQVETKEFQALGMITYDLETNTITGVFDFALDGGGMGRPDHISMSPSGKYVVPSWNAGGAVNCESRSALGTRDNPCGLMAYTRDFSKAVGLTVRGPHSDIGLDANGRDVIIASDYDSGWVEMWDLETGKATKLWQIYADGNGTAMHISAKSFSKPGWALISTYAEKQPGWYVKKIMAVEMKENPRILNIAHSYNEVETYFSETHAAVNRDFTRIMFNSNWNTANVDNIDAYMITLPDDAVPAVK